MADEGKGTDEGEKPDEEESVGPDRNLQADIDKWKALSRKHEAQAKSNADAARRLDEMENASKSEVQRLTDAATSAAQRADEAEARVMRYEVALEKEVPAKLMKFLAGGSREEIEASADELLAAVKPDTGSDGDANKGDRPREALRTGAANQAEPDEDDPREVIKAIPRDRF